MVPAAAAVVVTVVANCSSSCGDGGNRLRHIVFLKWLSFCFLLFELINGIAML